MTSAMDQDIDAVLAHVDESLDSSLARLFELIRIPSVSTDPAYRDHCRTAAEWLSRDLAAIGFEASVRKTTGHPMVVAHEKAASGPHLLFYGHYDVQPVDPLALWTSDPFEPRMEALPNGDTAIVARGASDDKGQLMTFVEACRAWKSVTGKLPVQVSMLFEGEEEAGGPSLAPFLDATADELKADAVFVCDTDMWDRETPAVTTMLRGIFSTEIEVTCADQDLHSGMFGNAARNPLQVLSDVVSSLRRADGGVAVEGFYDGVKELPDAIKALWKRLPFDEEAFLGDIGLRDPVSEADRSVLEQIWARPSCEINGMSGGYTGEGFKTVIPAKASAKISFRLVEGQDPQTIRDAFQRHVRARIPRDCSVGFRDYGLSPKQPSCRSTVRFSPGRFRRFRRNGNAKLPLLKHGRFDPHHRRIQSLSSDAMPSSSASPASTTASIARTKNTISQASIKACDPGSVSWPPSPTDAVAL